MKTIDAVLLAALEKGEGTPVMVCALFKHELGGWTLEGEYNVLECVLTRDRYDVFVQENLLASGLVDSVVDSGWAIEIERGLIVAGTKYSLVSNLYYISNITYSEHKGRTHLIADLLPTTSVVNVDGTQTARNVLQDAFDQWNNELYLSFDATRDIWFDWKFFDTDKALSLIDGRTLAHVIQQKYFAYFFPRWFHIIMPYGVASNEANPVDGTYTPFGHARTTYFLHPDKPINLTWDSETGYHEYIDIVTNGITSLGFISNTDNPTALAKFEIWTRIFSGVCLQYTQRPDLRLEQGDLVTVSTDGFDKTRCFETIEVYKSRNPMAKEDSKASWYQIVRQLPYHPQYSVSIGDDGGDDWWKKPYGPYQSSILVDPNLIKTQSLSFNNILTQDAATLQQALELLDKNAAGLHIANIFNAIQKINVNSTTAFVVENDGVVDNVLVVDTANGRIGIGTIPTTKLHIVGGQLTIADINTSSQLRLVDSTNTKTFYINNNADVLKFFNNNGELILLLDGINKRVGIGILAPTAKLHVAGDTKIDVNSTTALLVEQDGVKDNVLVVDTTNGRLGIGTTPNNFIHGLANQNVAAMFERNDGNGGIAFNFKNTEQQWSFGIRYSTLNNFLIKDETNSLNVVQIESGAPTNSLYIKATSGNVGLGINTASAKLHVVGSTDIIQTIIKAFSTQTANVIEQQQSGGTVVIYTTNTGGMKISDKLIFTQADGNEYIDSMADGYLDYGATTEHRFPTGDVNISNDLFFTGDSAGLSYGAIYGNEIDRVLPLSQNDWFTISDSDVSDGELNNVTHDGSGKLTVTKAGRYLINYSMTIQSAVANLHIVTGLSISGDDQDAGRAHTEIHIANQETALSGTAILDLAASDYIEAIIKTTDATGPSGSSTTIQYLNITLVMVGGT